MRGVMRRFRDRMTIGASIAAVLCASAVAVASAGGGESPEPLPFGTPQSEWTTPTGQEAVHLMPERAPVSTLDGQILRESTGEPVTVPLGNEARGSVMVQESDTQFESAMILQAQDACDRGIGFPIAGEASGDDMTMEEVIAEAKRNMEKALAANGGNPYRDACEVVQELKAQR